MEAFKKISQVTDNDIAEKSILVLHFSFQGVIAFTSKGIKMACYFSENAPISLNDGIND